MKMHVKIGMKKTKEPGPAGMWPCTDCRQDGVSQLKESYTSDGFYAAVEASFPQALDPAAGQAGRIDGSPGPS